MWHLLRSQSTYYHSLFTLGTQEASQSEVHLKGCAPPLRRRRASEKPRGGRPLPRASFAAAAAATARRRDGAPRAACRVSLMRRRVRLRCCGCYWCSVDPELCEQVLRLLYGQKQPVTPENLLTTVHLAEFYGLQKLLACTDRCAHCALTTRLWLPPPLIACAIVAPVAPVAPVAAAASCDTCRARRR